MIGIKTSEEIKIMQHGGHILSEVLIEVLKHVKPGVTEIEIDAMAEKMIREKGGEPGFMRVKGYHHATCISTNDVVVHSIPGNYKFKEGDVVGVDCGVYYKNFHTDMAETVRIKNGCPKFYTCKEEDEDKIDRFLRIGKKALNKAINVAVIGNRVGHISKTIQDVVEKEGGYSVVKTLTGHGVGRNLHEEPEIPGYLCVKIEDTPLLREGMSIAIEVIYNMGKEDVILDRNGWTIRTKDGLLAGIHERSIVVTKDSPVILTE